MRRLLVGLVAPVMLLAGLSAPAAATTSETTTVVHVESAPPEVDAYASVACGLKADLASNGSVMWLGQVAPTSPVPGFAPILGSRYLSYSGAAGYFHGPMITAPAGQPPTAVSAEVAAVTDGQQAMGLIVGYGPRDPSGWTDTVQIGVTTPVNLVGSGWTKISFTADDQVTFYSYNSNTGTYGWNGGPYQAPLSTLESGTRAAGWTWKVGVIIGACGESTQFYTDATSVTTAAGSTTTYDFEESAISSFISAGLSQRRVHVGGRVRVGGLVGPCTGSARSLAIQREIHGRWKTIGHGRARACPVGSPNPTARIHGRFRARRIGRWRVRVVAAPAPGYDGAVSRTLRLHVVAAPVRQVSAPVHYAPPPHAHTVTTTAAPPPPV